MALRPQRLALVGGGRVWSGWTVASTPWRQKKQNPPREAVPRMWGRWREARAGLVEEEQGVAGGASYWGS